MAQRSGIFGSLGRLWRLTIWGLAAVLVFAVYLNFADTDDVEVAAVEPEAAPVEEPAAVEEVTEAQPEPEPTVEEQVEALAEEVETKVEEVVEEATETAKALEGELKQEAETAVEALEEKLEDGVRDLASKLQDELGGAADATEQTASLTPDLEKAFSIPGDPASYEFLNAFKRDDGLIEVTTKRTEAGAETMTTRLVRCAPLEVGTIAEDGGERNDAPEMERITLGNAVASLAALACGAMK